MDLSFSFDESGRLRCALTDGGAATAVTATNGPEATTDFLHAIDAVHDGALGECFWHEQTGTYRWMFARRGDVVDVAVMWCAGVVTGWQHVFRAECDARTFERARASLQRLVVAS